MSKVIILIELIFFGFYSLLLSIIILKYLLFYTKTSIKTYKIWKFKQSLLVLQCP